MADWFKFYDDFFDDVRIRKLISQNPIYPMVYVSLLCDTSGGKKPLALFPEYPYMAGKAIHFNVTIDDVTAAFHAIRKVGLISGTDPITVAHWHKERPRYIPKWIKRIVLDRDGGKCVFCGSKQRIEYDHIVPVSKGGATVLENMQLLCKPCNIQKGAS